MKEIGERLRETRESMGISVEEAAEDLKIRPAQLENIEEGNKEAFKDVFYLKFFIRDYAKYLGLDYEALTEEFNEYLFDYTSRLSLDDIKKANEKTKKQVKKIASPYTLEKKQQRSIPAGLIYALIVLVIAIIIYCIVLIATDSKDNEDETIIINMEEKYEFA
ncbi:MAG: helix-turn-helix domain-containing protein [Bacilli bacterium]|nr:helix-turn-helix domain-containing protein [Bacilli bacterium]